MDELAKRKNLRLYGYDYNSAGAYFITICTDKKKNFFWSGNFGIENFSWSFVAANCVRPQNLPLSNIGKTVMAELEQWHQSYDDVSLFSYVIMPNHLHIMVVISANEYGRSQNAPTLDRMVKQFKGAVTKKIGFSLWQKSFYDHIIRNDEDYAKHLEYISENPLKWQLDELYTRF